MLEKTKRKIVKEAENQVIHYAEGDNITTAHIRVTVVGIRPLLTHNPASMNIEKGPGKQSRIPPADEEAEAGTYRLPDGTCAIKGESFRGALLGAASSWKAKGKRTMVSIVGHVIVTEELVPLQRHDGTPISDFAIDGRRAIVQKQGIIRHRPRFDEWRCTMTFEYDPALIPDPKIIVDILHDAGSRMGVGDYRPARRGFFGRFRVENYQLL